MKITQKELYLTFEKYRPDDLQCCICCHSEDFISRLKEMPLESLPEKDLFDYLSSALLLCEGENAFKYFLPRLLEKGRYYYYDIQRALERANWESWNSNEIQAVKTYLLEVAKENSICLFFGDLEPFFSTEEVIDILGKDSKILYDSVFYWTDYSNAYFTKYWEVKAPYFPNYWEGRRRKDFLPEALKRKLHRFLSDVFYEKIESDPEYAEKIAQVLQWVDWCKTSL